jgi:hypothetical protein
MIRKRLPGGRSRCAERTSRTRLQRGRPARVIAGRVIAGRVIAGIAVAGLVAAGAGCTASPSAAHSVSVARQAPASAWQLTLNRVGRNGGVDTATALAAFALAIGPVPRARPLAGPPQVIPSGTIAVQWVLGHWRRLTGRQRRAVVADLGVPARAAAKRARGRAAGGATLMSLDVPAVRGAPATGTAKGPDLPCLTADSAGAGPYRAQAAGIESDIAAHAGAGPFGPDVYFSVNATQLAGSKTKMYTYGCTGSQVTQDGPVQGCTIHVNPSVSGGGFPAAEVHDFLIHELTHCYLFQKLGADYYRMPAWYVEGVPMWAMTVLGNGSSIESRDWLAYLDTPSTPVFTRSYDALGFFVHLAETGTDVWHKIVPMGQAIASGGSAAGWRAAAPGAAFLDSWGSGYAQGRYPGAAWQTSGPNLPHYAGPIPQASLGDGQTITVSSPAAATAISRVEVDAQVVLVTGTASGRLSLDGGADTTLAQAAGTGYRTGDTPARCPADAPNAGASLTRISSGPHYVAVTGGLDAAAVQLQGLSLAAFCATKNAVACIVGDWTATRFQATDPRAGVSEEGGAGTTMRIGHDGSMSVDFGGMAPVEMTGNQGLQANFTFDGGISGTIRLPGGQAAGASTGVWRPVPGGPIDYGSLTVTVQVTSPISDTIGPLSMSGLASSLGAGASSVNDHPLGEGSWSCSGNTLVNRPPRGAPADGSWTWSRTG